METAKTGINIVNKLINTNLYCKDIDRIYNNAFCNTFIMPAQPTLKYEFMMIHDHNEFYYIE